MVLIEWRSEFETGIDEVDHEHRELIGMINKLDEALEGGGDHAGIADFLGEVFAAIAAHFALEETVMRKHGYDEYATHKQEHEKLLDDLRDIMDAHEDNPAFDHRAALRQSVRNWFVNHFKTKDARLHRILGV